MCAGFVGVWSSSSWNRGCFICLSITPSLSLSKQQTKKVDAATPPKALTLDEVAAALRTLTRLRVKPPASASWITEFRLNERAAKRFVVRGRVLLVGDAAHVHRFVSVVCEETNRGLGGFKGPLR